MSVWLVSWNPALRLLGLSCPVGVWSWGLLGLLPSQSAPDTPGPSPGQASGAEAGPLAGESPSPCLDVCPWLKGLCL